MVGVEDGFDDLWMAQAIGEKGGKLPLPHTGMAVLHFDLGRAPSRFTSAWLEVPLHCLDPEAPDGALSVHLFAGDGETSVDERGVGDPWGVFGCDPGEYPVLRLDLTEAVRRFLDAGHPYLSVRLRSTVGDERYDVGAEGGVDDPTLTFFQ